MIDKELIKQEIKRRIESINSCPFRTAELGSEKIEEGELSAYNSMLQFIDSIPEEPVSEGIENELERFAYSLPHSADGFWPKDIDCKSVEARTKYGVRHAWSYEKVMVIARHFAEWQREQLMKDAVDGEYWDGSIYLDNRPTYKDGDKVKIIIVKEEQQ